MKIFKNTSQEQDLVKKVVEVTTIRKRGNSMERLTNTGANGEIWITDNDETRRIGQKKAAYKKLKAYEDAEEQGLLLRLPCKVGDTVYCIFSRYTKCTHYSEEFDEYSCQGCEYECDSKREKYIQDMRAYSLDWIVTNLQNFGKTVFLTREEAEAKLKKMEKES